VVVPGWYKRGLSWSAILLASVIAYELGLRDGAWLLFVGIGFVPIGVVLSMVTRRLWIIKLSFSESTSMNLNSTHRDD
jgi:hypothetical protein